MIIRNWHQVGGDLKLLFGGVHAGDQGSCARTDEFSEQTVGILNPSDWFVRRGLDVKAFRALLCCVTLLAVAGVLWGQAPTDVGLIESPVYEKNCAKCHGKNADGRHFGGPSLRADKVNAMSTEDLRNIISNGKGRMPKYADKLSAEEIDALSRQIKALSKQ